MTDSKTLSSAGLVSCTVCKVVTANGSEVAVIDNDELIHNGEGWMAPARTCPTSRDGTLGWSREVGVLFSSPPLLLPPPTSSPRCCRPEKGRRSPTGAQKRPTRPCQDYLRWCVRATGLPGGGRLEPRDGGW